MSGIIKAFLLLAVVTCFAKAQLNEVIGQSCLCQRYRNGLDSKSKLKDIQFYPATFFCDKVEIVVTSENGYRYCLNTEMQVVKKMTTRFLKARKTSSGTTGTTGTSDTSDTSDISTTGTTGTGTSTTGTSDTSTTGTSDTSTSGSSCTSCTSSTSTTGTRGSWCLAE